MGTGERGARTPCPWHCSTAGLSQALIRPGSITPKLPAGNREEEALYRPQLPEAAGNDSSIRWQSLSQLPAGESRQGCAGGGGRERLFLLLFSSAISSLVQCVPSAQGQGSDPSRRFEKEEPKGSFTPPHPNQAVEAPKCQGMQLRELLFFGDAMFLLSNCSGYVPAN